MDTQDLRQRELNILIAFAQFCDEHHLKYYLFGGTLLGAIRHKGFIPWDDDIDVAMPRDDYERFYALTKDKGLENPQYQIIFYRDDSSCFPFMKIQDTHTLVKSKYRDEKYYSGLWIDIFPLDKLPIEDKKRNRMFQHASRLRFLLLSASANTNEAETKARLVVKKVLVPLLRTFGIQFWNQKFDQYISKYKNLEAYYIGNICWAVGTRETMPVTFLEQTEVEFEGHRFKTTKYWDYYLSHIYGDYMKLPPEEKRVSHFIEYEIKEDK